MTHHYAPTLDARDLSSRPRWAPLASLAALSTLLVTLHANMSVIARIAMNILMANR